MTPTEALIDLSQQHKLSLTEEHRLECYNILDSVLLVIKKLKNEYWFETEYCTDNNKYYVYACYDLTPYKEEKLLLFVGYGEEEWKKVMSVLK